MLFSSCIQSRKVVQSTPEINNLQVDAMIYTKDHKTAYLFDPWEYLGPKRRKLMDQSWAGLFKEEILPELPVGKIAPYFSDRVGRPTKELYAMLGAVVIQQMLDYSDEETVSQLAFNIQWHYALDMTEESDERKYISHKTLWSMRKIMTDHDLDGILFRETTDKLAKVFQVDTSKQRIDSVHIKSNMRHLGRIGIFVKSIHKFLVNLKRRHRELFDTLAPELVEKYLTEKALGCFSMVKPSESEKTLSSVSADLFDLAQRFGSHADVTEMSSYQLLLRVLKEQCHIKASCDGNPSEISVKAPQEVSSCSLQNPSDPDAAYDGHKGQGYQVQVMETYTDNEDKEIKSQRLDLITHVHVEQADISDVHALIPALESTQARSLLPEQVLADSLYGSDENCEAAKSFHVEITAPVLGGPRKHSLSLPEFEFSENSKITKCPQGHVPVKTTIGKRRHLVAFDSKHCAGCPRSNDCPARPGRRYHYLRFSDKELRVAKRRVREATQEFKDVYRFRAGIESTMSAYNARTGVKRLRVRGFKAVRFCATLKAIGINIFRAAAVRRALNPCQGVPTGGGFSFGHVVFAFKEQFSAIIHKFNNSMISLAGGYDFSIEKAA